MPNGMYGGVRGGKNSSYSIMSEIPQKAVVGPEEGYESLGE